jgi:UDP-N-acetylglucosamine 4,6-dehydratase
MSILDGKTILVTGGTGSFGKMFIKTILAETTAQKVIVFSRDELKQFEMAQLYPNEPRIRFFIGDVRDQERLHRAFHGVDLVVHAAAMKQIGAAEYNPFEAVRTNIIGAQNIINAAINQGVKKVVALSTDKASSPINLYGATKLVSDKLFTQGNVYAGKQDTRFSVVRYGNVVGSRGSVIPLFKKLALTGTLPITDEKMTRFWITLSEAVRFVLDNFEVMVGGEIFVPKIPSMRILDLAKAIAPDVEIKIVGIRPGEKLHEEMISIHDARRTLDVGTNYVIMPEMNWQHQEKLNGAVMPSDFCYSSDNNPDWIDVDRLKEMIDHGEDHAWKSNLRSRIAGKNRMASTAPVKT